MTVRRSWVHVEARMAASLRSVPADGALVRAASPPIVVSGKPVRARAGHWRPRRREGDGAPDTLGVDDVAGASRPEGIDAHPRFGEVAAVLDVPSNPPPRVRRRTGGAGCAAFAPAHSKEPTRRPARDPTSSARTLERFPFAPPRLTSASRRLQQPAGQCPDGRQYSPPRSLGLRTPLNRRIDGSSLGHEQRGTMTRTLCRIVRPLRLAAVAVALALGAGSAVPNGP